MLFEKGNLSRFTALLFTGAILILVPHLRAQSTGTISGTVADQTGGVVPGVAVTLTNLGTGVTRSVSTDAEGRYQAPSLSLGNYEVRAELPGFRTSVRRGIELTVGRHAVVDLTMSVGEVVSEVVVTGEAPLVETTTTELSQLVSSAEIQDLPIQGRNLTELAVLQTGVTELTSQITSLTSGPGKKISVGGARPNQSTFLLDGGDINNSTNKGVGGTSGLWLGKDTIREFAVLTSNYNAQYGKALGGIINAVSKSGENTLHGSVFELHRNDNMDASRWEDNSRGGGVKPEFKRNQFGFTLGGPIKRDQTFFFGSYEGFREVLGRTITTNVPSADSRRGIIHDPDGTTRQVTVDSAIQPILDLYPLPNAGLLGLGNTGRFVKAASETTNEDYYMIKVDHYFSESDSLFVRYTHDDSTKLSFDRTSSAFGFPTDLGLNNRYLTLEEKHIFSPTVLNVARAHFNRSRYFALPVENPAALIFASGRPWAGNVGAAGLTDVGNHITTPFNIPVNVFDYSNDLTYLRGAHSLQFGVLVKRIQENINRDFRASGTWDYNGGVEDLITNMPDRFQGLAPGSLTALRGYRETMMGFYAQDDWQVRPNLTLNLGLRYEFITNPTEVNGLIATVPADWDDVDPETGTIVNNIFKENPSLNNWAPRVGLAWDPTGSGRTAIRAGIGLFFDQIIPVHYDYMQWMPPLFNIVDTRSPTPYPDALQGSLRLRLSPYNADFNNSNTTTATQWNFSIQRELIGGTKVEAAYVANQGWHVPVAVDPNSTVPEFLADGTIFFPRGQGPGISNNPRRNPNWGRVTIVGWEGQSSYHSLQLSAEKTYGRGLRIRGNYVWSKSIDDGSSVIGADASNAGRARQNPFDKLSERGLSSFHVAHRFTLNYSYDLPFGNNLTGAARAFLGGWQLGGIVKVAQGPWFTAAVSGDASGSRINSDRPNFAPGANSNPIEGTTAGCAGVAAGQQLGTPDLYFDPCAFEPQPRGFFGNVGRNTVRAAGLANVDLSLSKNIPVSRISEGFNVQFRAELFNLFNKANFAHPSRNVFSSRGSVLGSVGTINRTVTSSRQLQIALKLLF